MSFKDHFSEQSKIYSASRPRYPQELFDYLFSLCVDYDLAWDCGTGNGQAAISLASAFRKVIATDPSKEQIQNAFSNPAVQYVVSAEENPFIGDCSVSLSTAATALHWFDIEKFFKECQRVLKPGGLIAAWGYTRTRISPEINEFAEEFTYNTLKNYWPPEFYIIDNGYKDIKLPYPSLDVPLFTSTAMWTAEDYMNYLRSWSGCKRYEKANGIDPVSLIESKLTELWGREARRIEWPLTLKVCRKP